MALGIAMTIEDGWGGDITTAAIAHLAHSTPTEFLFTANRLQQLRHGEHGRRAHRGSVNGRMAASTAPGLGDSARQDVLGSPVLAID